MRCYLVPLVAAWVRVGIAALLSSGCRTVASPLADNPPPPSEPKKIADRYPASKTYSAWRPVSPPGCPELDDVSDLAVGDVDGDDVLEIVFGSLRLTDSKGLHVMRRKTQDSSWECPEPLNVSQPVTRVAIVSLEPGSLPAVIAASTCAGLPCALKVEATPGAEPSVLFQHEDAPAGSVATDFRVADLDRDGVLDIGITFANLPHPSDALAPVILSGRLENNKWTSTARVLNTKISHSLAMEVGPFAADGNLGVLFGGIGEGCNHNAKERQPVGVLALRDGTSWQTHEVETQATGESVEPRWVVDLALGTTGTEVGIAATQSHCSGKDDPARPYLCSADARPELRTALGAETNAPRLLAPESGEWMALAYLGPGRWAVGFLETEFYLSGGASKPRSGRGSVLLVEEKGAEPTTRIPGRELKIQDVLTLSLRPREEQEQVRTAAREGTQITAYPLTFAPSLLCDGKPAKVDTMTWVPESRLVTIPKFPSPCPNAELTYLADKHPVLLALDRSSAGVFISEPVSN